MIIWLKQVDDKIEVAPINKKVDWLEGVFI